MTSVVDKQMAFSTALEQWLEHHGHSAQCQHYAEWRVKHRFLDVSATDMCICGLDELLAALKQLRQTL